MGLAEELDQCQSLEVLKQKVDSIVRWWNKSGEYMEHNSTPLCETVHKIMEAQEQKSPFPDGMDANWALDIQSAQTVAFLAALKCQNSVPGSTVAWDLGTLTGISAAVLSEQFDHVYTVEREESLANFARRHLDKSKVKVLQCEIDDFLSGQAASGAQADLIFMDLDKTCYEHIYTKVVSEGLLKPGGLLLADNVLYRGLTMQLEAGETPDVSEKTKTNAEALVRFNQMVRRDVHDGMMRSLMLPVRDGMLAVMRNPNAQPEDSSYHSSSDGDQSDHAHSECNDCHSHEIAA